MKPQVTPIAIYAGNDNLPEVTEQAWDAISGLTGRTRHFFEGGAPVRVEDDEQGNRLLQCLTLTECAMSWPVCLLVYPQGKDGEEVPAKPQCMWCGTFLQL